MAVGDLPHAGLSKAGVGRWAARCAEDRGTQGLGLLRDYAAALWSRGETPKTEKLGQELLAAFAKFHKDAVQLGSTDFSGIGFGAAQSLVMGADINRFRYYFPEAQLTADVKAFLLKGAKDGDAPASCS